MSSLTRVAKEVANRAPGHLVPVNLTGVPVEIKPVILEINNLFDRLYQALEREKRFAADAAHELRTPLAALKTQAQVALVCDDEAERTKVLENVVAGVDRSSHIVQQLLTLSRIVPGATHIEGTGPVNLTKLSAEVIAQLAPTALQKGIDIELISNNDDIEITGNITALSILIRNLVDNAIKCTPEHGAITLSLFKHGEWACLEVADTGIGMAPEQIPHIFDRFYRVDKARSRKSGGTGLGLAIVKGIAEQHGGKVTVTSQPGKGSTFTVWLKL